MDKMLTIRFDPRLVVLIGFVFIIIGAFLPWVNLPPFLGGNLTKWGLTGGGFFTLAFGLLGLISLLLPVQFMQRTALPAALLALLAYGATMLALLGLLRSFYLLSLSPSTYLSAIGSGLYLTFSGIVVSFVAAIWPIPKSALPPPSPTLAPASSKKTVRLEPLILAILIGIFPLTCACAILLGLLLGPISTTLQSGTGISLPIQPTPESFPAELLATPLVDIQVTLLGVTPMSVPPVPTAPTTQPEEATATPPIPPTQTPVKPTDLPTQQATRSDASTKDTATPPVSPLATPEPGK